MNPATLIDAALLAGVGAAARASPRRRRNHNFHHQDGDACQRLLNAIEPGSYVRPHRHLDPAKDETIIVLRGRLGAVLFDESGAVAAAALLVPGGDCVGIDIPHGRYHTLFALEAGSVMFEAKAGPFLPLRAAELAPWAPAEGSPQAAAYLDALVARLAP
jgi:cupin fold WbuC family metalloprotein